MWNNETAGLTCNIFERVVTPMTFAERLRAARRAKKEPERDNIPKAEEKGENEAHRAEKEAKKKEGAEELIKRIKRDLEQLEQMIRSE